MHPASQAVVNFSAVAAQFATAAGEPAPQQPQLHDAQVPDVIHALASDTLFGLGQIPTMMVAELGRPQSEADAMAAKIAAVQSSAAELKSAIDALNAILDG